MNKNNFINELKLRDIILDDKTYNELRDFMSYTIESNKQFNLTSITEEEVFLEKMIFDSLLVLYDTDLDGKKVLDLGTGAGYPGMVLAIINKSIDMTLLDSTKKKINYLNQYINNHNYKVKTVAARAEEYADNNREKYDFVIARAVTQLPILLELAIPLLKVGGTLIAYKGPDAFNEIKSSTQAIKKLKCHLQKTYEDTLPESLDKRCLIYVHKDEKTPLIYPRSYSEIKKLPL